MTHSRRTRLVARALTASVVCAAVHAHAQTPSAEARAAFQEGVRHFSEQRYAEALVAFQRAYRTRPHPSVLVNIANCQLALDQPHEAIASFERYLSDPAATISEAQRSEIQATVAEARRRVVSVTLIAQPTGAEVYIDGALVGTAPLRGARLLAPGPHVFEARVPGGASVQYQARFEAGRSVTLTLDTLTRQTYLGSVPPAVNDGALRTLASPSSPSPAVPAAPVSPMTSTAPASPAVPAAPTPPLPSPSTTLPTATSALEATAQPSPAPGETVSRRSSGFGVAMTLGAVTTLGALGAAIGVSLYNQRWIDEYNQYAMAFEYYRSRNVGLALQYQAQGREHLRVIENNETLAMALYVTSGVAAAVTLGMLLFWPRERVRADRAALRLRVSPTVGGVSMAGAF